MKKFFFFEFRFFNLGEFAGLELRREPRAERRRRENVPNPHRHDNLI